VKTFIMKLSDAILRPLLAFVAISVIQTVAGNLLVTPAKAAPPAHALTWMLLSNALTVMALTLLSLRTDWRGLRLGAAVAAVPMIIACTNFIEGAVFLTNSGINWPQLFAYAIVSAVLAVPVWTVLFGARAAAARQRYYPIASKSLGECAWKFVVCDLMYVFLYFLAGAIIFPYVKDFYATQSLPPYSTIFALQFLVRGPIFVVLCVTMVRMLDLPRLSGALAVGTVFAILNGIAPLLMPDPFFPDSVRWIHLCEVATSNFLFGAVVARLWGQPELAHAEPLHQSA
jgi:hypothetical protein